MNTMAQTLHWTTISYVLDIHAQVYKYHFLHKDDKIEKSLRIKYRKYYKRYLDDLFSIIKSEVRFYSNEDNSDVKAEYSVQNLDKLLKEPNPVITKNDIKEFNRILANYKNKFY